MPEVLRWTVMLLIVPYVSKGQLEGQLSGTDLVANGSLYSPKSLSLVTTRKCTSFLTSDGCPISN
jgi:hypothetical protein